MPMTVMTVFNGTGRPLSCGRRLIVPGGATIISFTEFQTHVFSDGVSNVVIKKQNGIVDFATYGNLAYEENEKAKRDDEEEERRYVQITVKGDNTMAYAGKWA